MSSTVIIADDDKAIVTVIERALEKRGFKTLIARNGDELIELVTIEKANALVLDVMMPFAGTPGSSFDYLNQIKNINPNLPIIIISALAALPTAVKATRLGAFDFIAKPFDLNRLVSAIEEAIKAGGCFDKTLQAEENKPKKAPIFMQMMGRSQAMQQVHRIISRVVDNDLTVMITGESGTGKELVARAIHELGHRAKKPFMAINMAAIPRELVESELFGHEKGSFTGAVARKAGLFEQAYNGTLFLDEIGDMPIDAQSKLLRVLQQGEFTAVGGLKPIKSEVRIICATHRDLLEKVSLGAFREDLYYRLNVVPIKVPSLKERKEDIPEIAENIIARAAARGLAERKLSDEALKELMSYDWPGNVRELENTLYRLMALSQTKEIESASVRKELPIKNDGGSNLEEIIEHHLQLYFSAHGGELPPDGLMERALPLFERPLLKQALNACAGNQLKCAKLLGINRNTLRKRMKELGISS